MKIIFLLWFFLSYFALKTLTLTSDQVENLGVIGCLYTNAELGQLSFSDQAVANLGRQTCWSQSQVE